MLASAAAHAEELEQYTGAQLYGRFCASCHGESGRGDGPVAPFFKLAVPDITRITKRHGTFPVEDVRRIIDGRTVKPAHGTRSMPVWGWEFRAAEDGPGERSQNKADELVARLVEHVRSIQKQ
jgi:mono/diheme cytochrome c family protein